MPLWFTPVLAQEDALQAQLVRAASDIRGIEKALQRLEPQMAALETKRGELQAQYDKQRAGMAATVSALARMGRTPREAVLIRPGGPLQAARTSMVLSASIPAIEAQAADVRRLLTDLQKTQTALADKTAQAKTARVDLAARHRKLVRLMDDRSGMDAEQTQRQAAQLARDARTLRDLLRALDGGAPMPEVPEAPVAMPDGGEAQLPVSGIIRVGYGAKDSIGAKSSGLSIETMAGSVVVAPLGGIVRYAGPFRGYGNIVIIAHAGGYHSLIAGLDKISVSAGQTIVSGEPIAILDVPEETNRDQPERRTVYYELRYGGQPVNPSRKLPDLG